jgi:hypothetical protein
MIPYGHDASCVFNTGGFVPSTMAGVHLAFVEGDQATLAVNRLIEPRNP